MDKAIDVPEDLIRDAMEVTGSSDEREAIQRAVREYVSEHRKSRSAIRGMLELAGTNPIRDDYDYKAVRAGDCDEDRR